MRSKSSVVVGLFIIALGIILLGNTFDFWNINVFFKGWWTLFIIIPSLIGMTDDDTEKGSIVGLVIGILLLLSCQGILRWDMMGSIFIGFLLIYIGLNIMIKPKNKGVKKNSEDEYLAIFSSNEGKVTGKLKDCDMISVFGNIRLDLKEAEIKNDVNIDCVSIFGSVDLKFGDDVNVKYSGVPIFGGIKKTKVEQFNEKKPTVNIDYVCIFGGATIQK